MRIPKLLRRTPWPLRGYTGRHRGGWWRGYDGPAAHQGATLSWDVHGDLADHDDELPPVELVTAAEDALAVHDALGHRLSNAVDTFRFRLDAAQDTLCRDMPEWRQRCVTGGEFTEEMRTDEVRALMEAEKAKHRAAEESVAA